MRGMQKCVIDLYSHTLRLFRLVLSFNFVLLIAIALACRPFFFSHAQTVLPTSTSRVVSVGRRARVTYLTLIIYNGVIAWSVAGCRFSRTTGRTIRPSFSCTQASLLGFLHHHYRTAIVCERPHPAACRCSTPKG